MEKEVEDLFACDLAISKIRINEQKRMINLLWVIVISLSIIVVGFIFATVMAVYRNAIINNAQDFHKIVQKNIVIMEVQPNERNFHCNKNYIGAVAAKKHFRG